MAIFSTAIFMFLALSLSMVLASDHSRLQDFCVADLTSQGLNTLGISLVRIDYAPWGTNHHSHLPPPHTHVNGIACKDPKTVGANDFAFSGLHKTGNTSNPIGSVVTPVTVFQLQGLNTLEFHSFVLIMLQAKQGIKYRNGYGYCKKKQCIKVSTLAVFMLCFLKIKQCCYLPLSSQNPGAITVANAVFGSVPDISGNIISRAFQLNKSVVNYLQSQF
ncbi:hypothetical protein FNV43_RR07327 [Rhamnella rubrinervis]|uniref:Germin-like protein n=1 Tax=Rhamnella rubrinervis TaxID=2594499 RepID=A0A8K0HEK4_9ROSA|nr:hypothetical protein FNV43_RR07327 [Rhamnella rubrinervis]